MSIPTTADYARSLDAQDPLAALRAHFVHADPELIYLDGNSLGRLPLAATAQAATLVHEQWGNRLIRGWNEGWFEAPERVGAKIARLIGADPDEVIVADSTSVNLFKLTVAALRNRAERSRILSDNLNFPSDMYVLQGVIDLLGNRHRLELLESSDAIHGPAEAITARLDEDVALLTLSHTVFKSGYVYDMAALNAAAHQAGALTLWDLSHSVGSVPLDLRASGADLAVGCCYKYLNGGPGAPAFLYVRRGLQEALINPIAGWMGQRDLFGFDLQYRPAPGIRRFLSGTPSVVSLSLIEPGVDLLLAAGMERLRAKSVQQSEYLIALWEQLLAPLGFTLNSPRDPAQRGSHVSLGHQFGLGIDLALIREFKVLPDFRPPDNLRLGIAPIYNSFGEIHQAVTALQRIVAEERYAPYMHEAPVVT
ncbi:MAG: kynureninase [Oscillochloris sp.]|nr:kynureninase [Oscillochloris sp.]